MPDVQSPRTTAQGAIFTTPVSLQSLEAEDQICPICREQYMELPRSTCARDSDQEWPVSVDMVAERSGLKRCCGHILGRRCLEKHLQARGEWRNKCPICRDLWFGVPITNDASRSEEPQAIAHGDLQVPSPLRRSSRIAFQANTRRAVPGPRMSARHGVRQPRRSIRPVRSPGFMQQLLGTLEIETGNDEVKGTLEEVKRKLDTLYGGLGNADGE